MEHADQSTSVEDAKAPPSRRLRVWLIVVSTTTGLAFVAGVPTTLFATYMAAFAADDPTASSGAVMGLMTTVWAVAAGFYILLVVGISGAWIAYRKRRNGLSFGMSLLAAAPILLIGLVAAALVVATSVWTASIQGVPSSVP
jgi:hypothetical protein